MDQHPASSRRRLPPVALYFTLSALYTLIFNVVLSVNLVYQTQEAGLNPLQLVLVGTVLEATVFVCEVPTGVVADAYSRRLSVIIGIFLMGAGFVLVGAFAQFETILAAQLVVGLGMTFVSGAQQAWIADEVGVDRVGQIYMQAVQFEQGARLVGIPVGIALGVVTLGLPIMTGGVLFMALAGFLALAMPETGFRPTPTERRSSFGRMGETFLRGGSLVRHSPLLMTVFAITAFYGMASEGFDRLWVKHFFDNLGFPGLWDLEPVVWFGVIRMGYTIIGIGVMEVVRRRIDPSSHRMVSRTLALINVLLVATIVVFASAGNFYVGMVAFWSAVTLTRIFDPLYTAWINQNVDSSVRATVISMSSQMNAFGQIAGGPLLGFVGTIASLRAALYGAAVSLSPALGLYVRAIGQGSEPAPAAEPTPIRPEP